MRVVPLLILGLVFLITAPASAAVTSVTPSTWNIIGLDSNSPATGPYRFPVGAKVCADSAGEVPVTLSWDSENPYIELRSGSLGTTGNPLNLVFSASGCLDAFFEAEVTRTSSAYGTFRRYHITAGGVSTPQPRELFVEYLVSQSRNYVTSVEYGPDIPGLSSVAAGGSMNLVVGNTYAIRLTSSTATQGYEQLETFINFPNTVFQILSISTTYTADTSADIPNPGPNHEYLYADACRWENDPTTLKYRSNDPCWIVGKAGGTIATTYTVKIISGGGSRETLNTLIYDFSGSSFHYNGDYSTSARYANIIDPTNVAISKSFTPGTITVGGVSTLTFTLTNPNPATMSNVSFKDVFPTTPGAMTLSSTTTSNTCGGSLTDHNGDLLQLLPTPSGGIKLTGGTVPANSTCTVQVQVTAATASGTPYNNSTTDLTVGGTQVCKTDNSNISTCIATASLTVSSTPQPLAPPSSCSGQEVTLATWDFSNYAAATTTNNGPFDASSKQTNVLTAYTTGYVGDTDNGVTDKDGLSASGIANSTPTAVYPTGWDAPSSTGNSGNSWGVKGGWPKDTLTGGGDSNLETQDGTKKPYFEFVIDTSNYGGVTITSSYNLRGNWSNQDNWYVFSRKDTDATWIQRNAAQWNNANSWQANAITAAAGAGTGTDKTYFRIVSGGAQNDTGVMFVDNVVIKGCSRPDPPTITKGFSPNTVTVGDTSTLTFTVTNPNAGSSLSGISFTDTLPANNLQGTVSVSGTSVTGTGTSFRSQLAAGSVILINGSPYTVSSITDDTHLTLTASAGTYSGAVSAGLTASSAVINNTADCTGGTASVSADGHTISVSGANIAAGAGKVCTVTATVKDSIAGSLTNVSGKVSATNSTENNSSNGFATASITAVAPPVISLQFSPSPSLVSSSTALTFTITNPNQGNGLSSIGFTQINLPANLTVPSPGSSAQCGGGTFTTTANTISFSGGSLAAGSACTFSANVTASDVNDYTVSTTVSHVLNGTWSGNNASATLVVRRPGMLFKQISNNSTGPWKYYLQTPPSGNVYYRFTLVNTENFDLTNVRINDDQEADGQGIISNVCGWSNQTLTAYDTLTCTYSPGAVTEGQHVNVAYAYGTYNTAEYLLDTASATYATTGLTLTKNATETYFNAAGNTLHYSYTVRNTGYAPLLGPVTVADDKLGTVSCAAVNTVGDNDNILDRDEQVSCPASGTSNYTVTAADVTANLVTNTASASTSSDGYITSVTSNTASKTVVYIGPPTVAKSFVPSSIGIHGTSVLTITLTNASSIAVTGAAFTDNYPSNLVNTGSANATINGSGCTGTLTGANNGSSLTLSGATIPASATCTYTVNVTSTTTGTYNNSTGNVTTSNTTTASPVYATLTVAPSTGSVMFVSDLSGAGDVTQTYPGSTVYIKVNDWDRNTVTTSAQTLSVTITTPAGDSETVTLTETGASTGIFTGSISTANGAPASGNGTLQVLPIEIVTVTYIDALDASFNPNQPRTDNLTVQYAADLSIIKATSNNTPNEGDLVVYTLTVTNNGPNNASGIQATDLLPTDVTYISDSGSGAYNRITGLWLVPNLSVGANTSLTITTRVNTGTIGSTITNSASITAAAQIDPVSSNNTATQSTIVVGGADIAVTKSVNISTPASGGAIAYTVTATNNGNNGATGVQVTDQLPAGVSYSSSTPSQGTYNSGTGVWNIGSLSNGASATLTINATVTAASGSTVTNTASMTAINEGDPVSSNNSASAAIIVGGADLAITKSVNNPTPNEGNSIAYTITVTNNGSNSANSIEITDQLPAGVSYTSDTPSQGSYVSGTGVWSVGSLANGASATLTINATVNAGTNGTTITNTATKTASDKPDPVSSNNSASASITVQRADLMIAKTVDNKAPSEGATIIYTLTVTNNGPNNATNITVTDVIPNGLTYVSNNGGASYNGGSKTVTWSIAGPLANGSSTSLNITCTVNAGTNGTTITNTANIASADQADPNSSNNSTNISIGVGGIDIAMTKTVNNPTPAVGGSVTFTITATNNGPNNATGVQVTDLLPAGLTYSSDTASQGTYTSGTGVWNIGALNNGVAVTLTLTATVSGTLGQTITNTASRTASDQTDANTANDNASASIVVGATDLGVSVSVSNPTPNVGNTITYTVTLTNNGPNNATGMQVTDLLPSGLTYSSSTPSQGTYTSGTGVWDVGALANGSSATLSIVCTVNNGTGGATIIDSASITASGQPDTVSSNNSANVSIVVQASDLLITYTASNLTPYENTNIVYTVTVTNNGPHNATGVTADVPLPAGVTYISDDSADYSSSGSTWTIGSLAKDASVTLNITVRVNLGTGGTTIANTVSISHSDQADPDASNNSAAVNVSPLSLPNIVILKSVLTYSDPRNNTTNPKAIPGASMLYTIQVKNMGLGSAQNVVVTDPMPAFTELDLNGSGSGPVSFIDGSPVSGLSYTFTALGSGADNISFSNNNGADYNYTPVPVNGFDANVTNIKISLGGVFNASDGTNHPSFELKFKVRIK